MSKIGERMFDDDGKIIVQKTYDLEPVLAQNAKLRSMENAGHFGESRLVGTVPGWLVFQWMKEAGISVHDTAARDELLKKKLCSGEFSKLRVWEGNY